tara:strand:- start:48 stop:215 length:168 start_codon:yes stop_codon:yes gene_type:complete
VNVLPQHRHSFLFEAEEDDFEAEEDDFEAEEDDFDSELLEHPTISNATVNNIVFI